MEPPRQARRLFRVRLVRALLLAICLLVMSGCVADEPAVVSTNGHAPADGDSAQVTPAWRECGDEGVELDDESVLTSTDLRSIVVTRAAVCEYENTTGGGGCCAGPDQLVRAVELDAETVAETLRLVQQTRPAAPNTVCMMLDSPIPLHYVVLLDTADGVRHLDVADEQCLGYELGDVAYDSGRLPGHLRATLALHGQSPKGSGRPCLDTRVVVRQNGKATELFPHGGEGVLELLDQPRAPVDISGDCSALVRVSIFEGSGRPRGQQLPTHQQLRMPPGLYTITVDFPTCAYSSTTACDTHLTTTRRVVRIKDHPTTRPPEARLPASVRPPRGGRSDGAATASPIGDTETCRTARGSGVVT